MGTEGHWDLLALGIALGSVKDTVSKYKRSLDMSTREHAALAEDQVGLLQLTGSPGLHVNIHIHK